MRLNIQGDPELSVQCVLVLHNEGENDILLQNGGKYYRNYLVNKPIEATAERIVLSNLKNIYNGSDY